MPPSPYLPRQELCPEGGPILRHLKQVWRFRAKEKMVTCVCIMNPESPLSQGTLVLNLLHDRLCTSISAISLIQVPRSSQVNSLKPWLKRRLIQKRNVKEPSKPPASSSWLSEKEPPSRSICTTVKNSHSRRRRAHAGHSVHSFLATYFQPRQVFLRFLNSGMNNVRVYLIALARSKTNVTLTYFLGHVSASKLSRPTPARPWGHYRCSMCVFPRCHWELQLS